MRKIEEKMVAAVLAAKEWKQDNTLVEVDHRTRNACKGAGSEFVRMKVYLYDNHIASVELVRSLHENKFMVHDVQVNEATLAEWPTRTTMSRLRALGARRQLC